MIALLISGRPTLAGRPWLGAPGWAPPALQIPGNALTDRSEIGKGSLKNGRMKLVQSLPVGSRERIIIVDVDGEEYVPYAPT